MPPILIFTKSPTTGTVKTRLIPYLSAEDSCNLHKELLENTLRALKNYRLQLWCSPDHTHPFLRYCQNKYPADLLSQIPGNLGEKMGHALSHALKKHPYTVLIGSDCPVLTASHVEKSLRALQRGDDAVVTPTEDGGFCLIGLKTYHPTLFKNIDWGSEQVYRQLKRNMALLKWNHTELETLWDVDRPEDYTRYKNSIIN